MITFGVDFTYIIKQIPVILNDPQWKWQKSSEMHVQKTQI